MGRPREADTVDMQVESLVAEANGNGVEHHSPLKSNRSPSQRSQAVEPRKSDSCPDATASSTNETAHENGVITPVMEDGGAEVSKDLTDEEKKKKQQEQTAQDVRKRMWFVRLPKPQYISSEEQQDDENKKKKMQEDVKQQNSVVNVLKGSRDKLRTMRGGALTACKSLRDALAVKDKELDFYKQERKRRTQRMNVELPHPGACITEKELDAAIEPLEHRMNHESLTKAEENKVFKEIQKLRAQRKQVKENEEVYTKAVAEHEARMAEREAAATMSLVEVKSREEALRLERDAMWNDRTAQSAVYEELRKEADRLDAEVNEALAVLKIKKDALEDFKAEIEGKQGDVLEPWRSNRRFSQSVRELIKKGQIDLARQQCLEETNKWLKMLEDDDNFRKEYHVQWAKVRADEAERQKVLEEAAKASASGEGPKIPMKKMETAKEAIDKAMKMAESRPRPSTNGPTKGRRKAPPAAAAAPDGPAAAVAADANGHASEAEQAEVQGPAEPHETLGAEQMKELAKHQKAEQEKSGVHVPAPAKPKAPRKIHKKPIVSIPAIVNDKTEFELPPAAAAFIKREVEVDEEEERERARLRNAEAAREAEARKERKRRKAEQKAQKTRDALKAAAVAPKEDDEALKEPAAPVSEEVPAAAAAAAEAPQASAAASAAAVAAPKAAGGAGKPSGRVGKHIGAPVAKSRLQVNRRKGMLQRALAFLHQQLPKSMMHRLLMAVLALLAVWLLIELLLPRRQAPLNA